MSKEFPTVAEAWAPKKEPYDPRKYQHRQMARRIISRNAIELFNTITEDIQAQLIDKEAKIDELKQQIDNARLESRKLLFPNVLK